MITKEDLEAYSKIINELDVLCEKYSERYLEDWEHYHGWELLDDNIIITYWFEVDWGPQHGTYNKEYGSLKVPVERFLEECKELLL